MAENDLKTKRIINNLDAFLDRVLRVRICNRELTNGEKYICAVTVAEIADEILTNLADSQDSAIRKRAKFISEGAHNIAKAFKPLKTEGLCMPDMLKMWLNDAINGDAYMVSLHQLVNARILLKALEDPAFFKDLGYSQQASETLTSEEIYASALAIAAFADYHVNNFRHKKDHGPTFQLRALDLAEKAHKIADRHKPIGKNDLSIPDFIQEILRKEDIIERE